MSETRKISELTQVDHTISDDTEFMFVHYGETLPNITPSPSPSPTPTPSPTQEYIPPYTNSGFATLINIKNTESKQFNNFNLNGPYYYVEMFNDKPFYTNLYSNDEFEVLIYYSSSGYWLIEYFALKDNSILGNQYKIAYFSLSDALSPDTITDNEWFVYEESEWSDGVTLSHGMGEYNNLKYTFYVKGNAYKNGYDDTNLFLNIHGHEESSTKDISLFGYNKIYLENVVFDYSRCGENLPLLNFNNRFYNVFNITENINAFTEEKNWDLILRHGDNVISNCGGTYTLNTGIVSYFQYVEGGTDISIGITKK